MIFVFLGSIWLPLDKKSLNQKPEATWFMEMEKQIHCFRYLQIPCSIKDKVPGPSSAPAAQ